MILLIYPSSFSISYCQFITVHLGLILSQGMLGFAPVEGDNHGFCEGGAGLIIMMILISQGVSVNNIDQQTAPGAVRIVPFWD